MAQRVQIYQIFLRHFGNANGTNQHAGDRFQNGCGKFSSLNHAAIEHIVSLSITHVWLTGVIRHASLTSYPTQGMAADNPNIVKGKAGSPYAIKDYYDVQCDFADNPSERMAEFEALVRRLHSAGLKVLLDFVPNHVSRAYGGTIYPDRDFGKTDKKNKFFDPNNDHFYLVDPPKQTLFIEAPSSWHVPGLDGCFAPEDGLFDHVPRATGNNNTHVRLGPYDWYDTVKLNYGFNFVTGEVAYHYGPTPLWYKMDAILAYWQDKGIDGFRCDFAHWVPIEFWRFATERARRRQPDAFFLAEAYDDGAGNPLPGSPPGTSPRTLVTEGGFDAVYDHVAFQISKNIASGIASASALESLPGRPLDKLYVPYVENHDERRAASARQAGASAWDTGYGSGVAGWAASGALYLLTSGPILFYAGQELGETGDVPTGYGGNNGRSSIFDYGSPTALRELDLANYDPQKLPKSMMDLLFDYQKILGYTKNTSATDNIHMLPFHAMCEDREATEQAKRVLLIFLREVANKGQWIVAAHLGYDSRYTVAIDISKDIINSWPQKTISLSPQDLVIMKVG